MTPFTDDLLRILHRDLACFVREVEAFPDDVGLWRTVPGITNNAGNLALHVAGNLSHFVGAVLGHTGYVRDREAEFARREGSRAEVAAHLAAAAREVEAGLARVTEADLAAPYPQAVGGHTPPTGRFLLHLAAHTAFHLGQAGYLRRTLTGTAGATRPMDLGTLPAD